MKSYPIHAIPLLTAPRHDSCHDSVAYVNGRPIRYSFSCRHGNLSDIMCTVIDPCWHALVLRSHMYRIAYETIALVLFIIIFDFLNRHENHTG